MNPQIVLAKDAILKSVSDLESATDLPQLRKRISSLRNRVLKARISRLSHPGTHQVTISRQFLTNELDQIAHSQTLERANYYLARLRIALTTEKTNAINDLNLRRWKEYTDIWTDSLWLVSKRDSSAGHSAWYWGNFIPQIPNQLLRRYTKQGDWVLDPFAGSGTTLLECIRLNRNGLGIELNRAVAAKTSAILNNKRDIGKGVSRIEIGDSTKFDIRKSLKKYGRNSVQLVLIHPPYHDIIRFSKSRLDLSNAPSTKRFLQLLGKVVENALQILDRGRFLVLVIGDKYSKREWTPLGFLSMSEVLKHNCALKSIVVKNFDHTAGKRKHEALWRYRALAGGFYVFKHEYIFIFQKR